MKKSLLLLAMGLSCISTYAQDDDVYFVPSSKNNTEQNNTYTASERSSYSTINGNNNDQDFQSSNWANGRGNGKWDVDTYNRRGKNYKGNVADTLNSQQSYNQGYEDGYEDGSCTARIVRFWSPRAGVYVSSPYYMDYYDLCYAPFFYGYASPWSFGWSSWWGWGSWYGWRPYYSSWYGWGWGGWYDPWYDPWYGYGWGGYHGCIAWRPSHIDGGNWRVGNTRQPFINAGNRASANNGFGGRGNSNGRGNNIGFINNRPSVSRSGFNNSENRSTIKGSTSRSPRILGNFDGNNRSNRSTQYNNSNRNQQQNNYSRPSRNINNTPTYSCPSRSNFGGGFGGGGSFGGGSRGGGRSFGGRR